MEAKELMLADIVKTIGGNIVKTDYFFLDVAYCSLLDENGKYCKMPYYNLFPVPLTDEILKRNGFDIYGHHAIYYVHKDEPDEVVIHVDYCESLDIDSPDYKFSGICKFVHKLQHALRLCGLNELADNFKI